MNALLFILGYIAVAAGSSGIAALVVRIPNWKRWWFAALTFGFGVVPFWAYGLIGRAGRPGRGSGGLTKNISSILLQGSDAPPLAEWWLPFFGVLLLAFVISAIAVHAVALMIPNPRRAALGAAVAGTVVSLIGVGYVALVTLV